MKKSQPPRPTNGELAILRILWQRGPSTVRQVHEDLNQVKRTGYTTALKIMQRMTEKNLVQRDESQRTHVYVARFNEEHTQQQLVQDLMDRAYGGRSQQLVIQALSAKRASPDELAEIRRLLDEMEGEKK